MAAHPTATFADDNVVGIQQVHRRNPIRTVSLHWPVGLADFLSQTDDFLEFWIAGELSSVFQVPRLHGWMFDTPLQFGNFLFYGDEPFSNRRQIGSWQRGH